MFCISDDQKFSRPFCVVLASIDSSKSILSRCVGFSSEKVSEKSDKKSRPWKYGGSNFIYDGVIS